MALIQTLCALSHPVVFSARCTTERVEVEFVRLNALTVGVRPDNAIQVTAVQWRPVDLADRFPMAAALVAALVRANQVHVDLAVRVDQVVVVPVLVEWLRVDPAEEQDVVDVVEPAV